MNKSENNDNNVLNKPLENTGLLTGGNGSIISYHPLIVILILRKKK